MGEYEPNDSRNVTGAGAGQQQQGQDGPGQSQPGQNQSGQTQQGQTQQGQNQGQPGQPQQFQSDSGQMGGDPGAESRGAMHQGARNTQSSGAQGELAQQIREHMRVIGADGVPVGTVDSIEGDRIKLTKNGPEGESGAGFGGSHSGHHHYLSLGLVAAVDGQTVRLSANGDVAYGMEEEE